MKHLPCQQPRDLKPVVTHNTPVVLCQILLAIRQFQFATRVINWPVHTGDIGLMLSEL
jgi:hypothetical protein